MYSNIVTINNHSVLLLGLEEALFQAYQDL